MKSLHTCNSILDRNISEDGQDRTNRGAFKFTEKVNAGFVEEIFKPSKPTAIVKPKRKRNFSEDSANTSSSNNSKEEKTGLNKNNKKPKIEGKLKQKMTKIALFDDEQKEFSDEEEEKEDFKPKKKTTIFIDSSQDDINCCEFCDKIFVSPDAYGSHMYTEHKKTKRTTKKVKKISAKEEVKCCNLCGNIYITKDAYVAHMKTNHSNEMKNGFEHYDRKLPNKVNDELVETLKKVKNKPMPKSRKKILFSNAFEKSQEQCEQQHQQQTESTSNNSKGEHKFWHYKQIPIASVSGVNNKNRKKSREIVCQDCDEVFATKESKNLHTCNSILDRGALVDGQERKKQRVERGLTK